MSLTRRDVIQHAALFGTAGVLVENRLIADDDRKRPVTTRPILLQIYFQVAPERTMYVGDNPAVDVDVPHEAGMITVHSRRSGKHLNDENRHTPDHVIHNFWDLLEVIDTHYEKV